MNIEEVLENIKHINSCAATEFSQEIITAFQGYDYDGETNVIVDKQDDLQYGNTKVFSAFINHEDAPIIRIQIEKSRGPKEHEVYYNIKDVYVVS